VKEVIGNNIKKMREIAGISQEAFAEKLDVSRATLSAIENGHVAIDSSKLLQIAQILGRPVSDFFEEKAEALALLYRAAEDAVAPVDTQRSFERFCKAYRELEEIVGVQDALLPAPEYSYFPEVHSRPQQFASQVAASERERLGLGQRDPIENIFKLLDEQGVRIFRQGMPNHEVYGLSAFSPRYGLCVFVNQANTLERQTFSLAHEYGHLLMHRSFYQARKPFAGLDKNHEMEEMAQTFAANLLVPELGLREVFMRDVGENTIGIEDIVFLKRYFRVSVDMMLRRLKDLRLISQADYNHLLEEVNKRRVDETKELAPMSSEPVEAWEEVSRFWHLARKAALDELVSLGKLAQWLGLNVVEMRKKIQEWQKEVSFAQA